MDKSTNMGAKILIVDDEPNLLRMVGYTLQAEGYKIVVAKNGAEALNKVQTEKPDLLILDVMMPDMSGIEVCEQLRKSSETVDLPIIMLSAKVHVPDKIRGLEAGADEYITKPIMPEELVARVRGLLERFRQIRQTTSQKIGTILAFIGAKGGVGTTTVALNVAHELARKGKSVVVAELRSSFGTFSAQLNLTSARNIMEALEPDRVHTNKQKLNAQIIHTAPGLKVLLGPQKVNEFREIGPQQAESIIDTIASIADYIILDLPCHPSEASQVAIQRCNFVGLVIEPERTCLMSGKVTKELLTSWGVGGSQVGVVVVRREPAASIRLEEITTHLVSEIIGVIPPAPEAFIAAQSRGVPIVVSNPESFSAKALCDIANKLSTY